MFRLSQESAHLINCPPSDCTEQTIVGIRFVFEPVTTGSFVTHYEQDREKFAANCIARSLSFFDSVANAKRRLEALQKNAPQITLRIGTHLAQGEIEGFDGVVSQVDRRGHFSLYEYAERNLAQKFAIVERL